MRRNKFELKKRMQALVIVMAMLLNVFTPYSNMNIYAETSEEVETVVEEQAVAEEETKEEVEESEEAKEEPEEVEEEADKNDVSEENQEESDDDKSENSEGSDFDEELEEEDEDLAGGDQENDDDIDSDEEIPEVPEPDENTGDEEEGNPDEDKSDENTPDVPELDENSGEDDNSEDSEENEENNLDEETPEVPELDENVESDENVGTEDYADDFDLESDKLDEDTQGEYDSGSSSFTNIPVSTLDIKLSIPTELAYEPTKGDVVTFTYKSQSMMNKPNNENVDEEETENLPDENVDDDEETENLPDENADDEETEVAPDENVDEEETENLPDENADDDETEIVIMSIDSELLPLSSTNIINEFLATFWTKNWEWNDESQAMPTGFYTVIVRDEKGIAKAKAYDVELTTDGFGEMNFITPGKGTSLFDGNTGEAQGDFLFTLPKIESDETITATIYISQNYEPSAALNYNIAIEDIYGNIVNRVDDSDETYQTLEFSEFVVGMKELGSDAVYEKIELEYGDMVYIDNIDLDDNGTKVYVFLESGKEVLNTNENFETIDDNPITLLERDIAYIVFGDGAYQEQISTLELEQGSTRSPIVLEHCIGGSDCSSGSHTLVCFLNSFNVLSFKDIQATHIVGAVATQEFAWHSDGTKADMGKSSITVSDLSRGQASYIGKFLSNSTSTEVSAKLGYGFDIEYGVYDEGSVTVPLYTTVKGTDSETVITGAEAKSDGGITYKTYVTVGGNGILSPNNSGITSGQDTESNIVLLGDSEKTEVIDFDAWQKLATDQSEALFNIFDEDGELKNSTDATNAILSGSSKLTYRKVDKAVEYIMFHVQLADYTTGRAILVSLSDVSDFIETYGSGYWFKTGEQSSVEAKLIELGALETDEKLGNTITAVNGLEVKPGEFVVIADGVDVDVVNIIFGDDFDYSKDPIRTPLVVNFEGATVNSINCTIPDWFGETQNLNLEIDEINKGDSSTMQVSVLPTVLINGLEFSTGKGGEENEYNEYGNKIIWNFPNLVTANQENKLVKGATNFPGHIVAPQAELWAYSIDSTDTLGDTFVGGNINGSVIVANFRGGSNEMHMWAYDGFAEDKGYTKLNITGEKYFNDKLNGLSMQGEEFAFVLDILDLTETDNATFKTALKTKGYTVSEKQEDYELEFSVLGKEVLSDENGKITFPTLVFGEEGTYFFKITEVDQEESNISYDDMVYVLVVEVGKIGDNGLHPLTTTLYEFDGTTLTDITSDGLVAKFYNYYNNVFLPLTGGSGTSIYVVVSLSLMSVAMLMYLYKRRQMLAGK